MSSHAPVLAVLPVLFANGDERAFFTARPELLAGLVREILATPGLSRLCIVAEEGVSLPPADGARVQVIRLPVADRPRTAAHPFDCPGLAAALADPDQAAWKHVLCLDSRQPRQTAAVLAAALDRYFRETPPVMVSVRPVQDHPCQFLRHARTLEQGLIHLFEAACARIPGLPPGLPHRVGRPVPVDWSELPAVRESGERSGSLWAPEPDAGEAGVRPVAPDQAAKEPVVWLVAGPDRARVLVHPRLLAAPPRVAAGVIHGDLFRPEPKRPVLAGPDGGLEIAFGAGAGETVVLLAACAASGRAGEAARLLPRQGDGRVVYTPDAAAPCGLLFTRLLLVEDGPFDLSFPFRPEDAPWAWDRGGALVKDATGQQLLGRQDFPPVLAREPGLVLFRRDRTLDAVAALVSAGQALGWSIDHPALDIRSTRDAALEGCRLVAEHCKEP